MAKSSVGVAQAHGPIELSRSSGGDFDSSPKLQGLDSNLQGSFGPQFWQAFRDTLHHLYTVSLPDPSEEVRFTLRSRTYPTTRAILMRTQARRSP